MTPIRENLETQSSDDPAESPEPVSEPTPVGRITPPDELSDAGRKWFDFYADQADGIRRYTQGDAQGLAALAEATADYWKYTQELNSLPAGTPIKDRWIVSSQRTVASKEMIALLKEYGLTWKSRGNK